MRLIHRSLVDFRKAMQGSKCDFAAMTGGNFKCIDAAAFHVKHLIGRHSPADANLTAKAIALAQKSSRREVATIHKGLELEDHRINLGQKRREFLDQNCRAYS